jgi:ABC-type proline/glycine betaine transport system permease subunit
MGVVALATRPVIRVTSLTNTRLISFLFFMLRRLDKCDFKTAHGNRTFPPMSLLLLLLLLMVTGMTIIIKIIIRLKGQQCVQNGSHITACSVQTLLKICNNYFVQEMKNV